MSTRRISDDELSQCLDAELYRFLNANFGEVCVKQDTGKAIYKARAIFMFASYTYATETIALPANGEEHAAAVQTVVQKLRAREPPSWRRAALVLQAALCLMCCFPCLCAAALIRRECCVKDENDDDFFNQ